MWTPQAEGYALLAGGVSQAKWQKPHFHSQRLYATSVLTILPFALRGIVVRKTACISCVRNGATVGSKDYDISSHSGGVAEGHQLCRVNFCVSPRVGRSNEERAKNERREGHLEITLSRLCGQAKSRRVKCPKRSGSGAHVFGHFVRSYSIAGAQIVLLVEFRKSSAVVRTLLALDLFSVAVARRNGMVST
jgi:hypothetical protein